MTKLNRQQIHERAMKVLDSHPQGIRWIDLLRAVDLGAPETPHNSIHGGVHNLLTTRTHEIVKVARGTYQLKKYVDADNLSTNLKEAEPATVKADAPAHGTLTEQDFTSALPNGFRRMTRRQSLPRWAEAASAANGARPTLLVS